MDNTSQHDLMKRAYKYELALVSYAYTLCRDWGTAEDMVHEAYLVLMENWESYNPEYSVYTWVRKMVYFKAIDHMAKVKRVARHYEELAESVRVAMEAEAGDDESARQYAMQMSHLDRCMEGLGEKAREMVVLYYWDKHSCDQIADSLKRSVNAVWLSLSRIRKGLKECVERQMSEERFERAGVCGE